jgi:ribosomal protein S8
MNNSQKKTNNSNNAIAGLISQLNLGSMRRLRYTSINYTKLILEIIKILYKEGIIRLYVIKADKILVYLKYFRSCHLFKFKLISKPSKKIYLTLSKLALLYNKNNLSGIYIISTPHGLLTSNDCLLYKHISGEILFKVYI